MQVLSIGYHVMQQPETSMCNLNGLDGRLLLLTHTPIRIRLGDTERIAQPGDLVIFERQTPIWYQAVWDTLLCDWVEFDVEYDSDFYRSLQLPTDGLLRFGDTVFLCTLLRQLCAEFYAENQKRADMTDCLMKALLIRIAETTEPVGGISAPGGDPHYQALVRVREKIYANPQEKWSVDLLCSEVNMSRSYFQLIYRETFGVTCIADVINCKMNRARELLTATSYTISHIAMLCGYENEEHFMRQFKKNNGVTPTVYRREHTS